MLEFPSFLRGPVQANYSRNDGARFQASQPASGAYFSQIISDDVPSYFDVQFVFERDFASAFRAWLRQNSFEILTGAQFTIPLAIGCSDLFSILATFLNISFSSILL